MPLSGKMGRIRESVDCSNRSLELDPASMMAWYNKGVGLMALGEWAEAQACFDSSLKLDDRYAPAWFSLGNGMHS